MAPEINLLPDEQRRAERRELDAPRPNPSQQLSQPGRVLPVPPTSQPVRPPVEAQNLAPLQTSPTPKPAKPGLLAGLTSRFGRKQPKENPVAPGPASALEVNLIPQETSAPSWTQLWPLIAAVGGAAAAVALAYIGLGLSVSAKQASLAQLRTEESAIVDRLNSQQSQVAEMSLAVQQVKAAGGLLDDHIYWTQFFDWLETATMPDVYFSGFMGDVTGKFTLTASARDYITLAQQLVSLQADHVNVLQVSVSEASRDSQGWVNFSLNLSVSPTLFTQQPQQQ